jgi:hypothetical protein
MDHGIIGAYRGTRIDVAGHDDSDLSFVAIFDAPDIGSAPPPGVEAGGDVAALPGAVRLVEGSEAARPVLSIGPGDRDDAGAIGDAVRVAVAEAIRRQVASASIMLPVVAPREEAEAAMLVGLAAALDVAHRTTGAPPSLARWTFRTDAAQVEAMAERLRAIFAAL